MTIPGAIVFFVIIIVAILIGWSLGRGSLMDQDNQE